MSIATLIRRRLAEGASDDAVIAEAIREAERREAPPSAAYQARMSTRARKQAFDALCNRDGSLCAQCGISDRTIWRAAGVYNNDDWGNNEDGHPLGFYTKVNASSNLEVDHILALHLGGSNDLENLWLLCRDCHKIKTAREQSQRLKRLFAQ
jgi:5-methylcytosine-specific restriction endonuclease McrA